VSNNCANAFALHLRGLAAFYRVGNRQANEEALLLFKDAIELDPDFAPAYGRATFCHAYAKTNGWFSNTLNQIAEVTRLAQRAVTKAVHRKTLDNLTVTTNDRRYHPTHHASSESNPSQAHCRLLIETRGCLFLA
jgi:hypothetical protein